MYCNELRTSKTPMHKPTKPEISILVQIAVSTTYPYRLE